jgi:hypothetical protein
VTRRLQVLFLVALLGVLLCLGLLVAALAGPWAALAYAATALVLLTVGSARARAAQAAARARAPRACTCCGSDGPDDHAKPVTVI